jgi:hypothetical protein
MSPVKQMVADPVSPSSLTLSQTVRRTSQETSVWSSAVALATI